MKYIVLLVIIFLPFCLQRPHFPSIVYSTKQSGWISNRCVYYVKTTDGWKGSFIDKCGKYNVGDTVKLIP